MKRMTNIIYPAFTVSGLPALHSYPERKRSVRHRMAAMRGGNTAEGRNARF